MTVLSESWERTADGVSMRRRLARLLGAIAAMLALALTVALLALTQSRSLGHRVEGTFYDAIVHGDNATIALRDADAAVRSYVATCDPAALGQYERALAGGTGSGDAGPAGLDLLDASTLAALEREENPEIFLRHGSAEASVDQWVAVVGMASVEAVDTAREEARTGGPTCPERAAALAPSADRAELFLRQAQRDVAEYLDEVKAQREAALTTQEHWNQLLLGSVVTLVLVVVLMGALMWLALETWVIKPLQLLSASVRIVSGGVLEREIHPDVGVGEVAVLAAHVETMRRELVHQVDEIRLSHQEIEDAHRRLSLQTEELGRSNRDLEQFAYVASHDLQEPLRKVASFTQLLRKRYGGQLDETADLYIDYAVDGAKRMQQLIQDLLAFSRVGRVTAARTDVPLEELLAASVADLDELIQENDAVVTHGQLPVVHGERALLSQLVTNLVSNAVKFRHPDRRPEVHVDARGMRAHWEISVVDNGIGIDPRYTERVFVIFQRLHGREDYPGTGIGLALVKRIVEHHGGRVWIEPTPGGGTTVRFTLARTPSTGAAGRASTERAQSTTLG
ncbi:sensor histidine kinase [Antribacter gilvus]|uniref:sensor histidine kinase n=1 Tax=Antribacter gilvus TaxID=2304675 RepID=UPI001F0B9BCB|nr:ATP-binding protein [Antribacter gilvus]